MIKKSWLFCQILNTKNKIWSPSDYVSNFYVDWLEKEDLIHNIFICFENAFAKTSLKVYGESIHENQNHLYSISNLSGVPMVSPKH